MILAIDSWLGWSLSAQVIFNGAVLGLVVGAGLALGLRAGLEAFGIELPSTSLVIQSRTIIVALVVGIVVTAISALIPAVRASRVPPVAAMREEAARPKRRSLTFRTISGCFEARFDCSFGSSFRLYSSGGSRITF